MAQSMKAAVVHAFKQPLQIEAVPVPEPDPGQILVRIAASGVCHTDLHAADGDRPVKPSPYLYDKPYVDNARVRVAGPFTVESLSPHRVLPASEEELIDEIDAAEGRRSPTDADLAGQDLAAIVIDYLRAEGVRQQAKGDRITFESIAPWPDNFIGASGTFIEGENGPERRAAILIGPEYGTVGRQDIVAAA